MAAKKAISLGRFIWEYFKVNLQSAMEYRISFIMQVIFMFLNDVIWVIFWMIFFNKFPSLNSWGFNDMMMLYMIATIAWGLMGGIFGNFRNIADIIKSGQLDFYLTLPKEELTHLLISKGKFDAWGDVLFGIVIGIIFLPIAKLPLAILLCILSTILFLSFAIILGALSFYLSSSTEIADFGLIGILSIASYPFSVFQGFTKFFLLAVLPAGFITGVPVELLKTFNWEWLGLMFLAAAALLIIAVLLFKKGIKRYESGNLINVRV
jgi:ABC-2 type transport system permease protein